MQTKFFEMSGLFCIPVKGIKDGHHTYKFEIRNEFFELFEESEIKEGELNVTAGIEKYASHMDLNMRISGKVKISCDRCLEMFYHPLECENRLVIKFGHEHDESDPDVVILSHDDHELDLKQYIYEFIHLSLPIQRFHPDDDKGYSTCNPEMLQKLREHLVKEKDTIDMRWEGLDKLIKDN